jgi:hypothetical protein
MASCAAALHGSSASALDIVTRRRHAPKERALLRDDATHSLSSERKGGRAYQPHSGGKTGELSKSKTADQFLDPPFNTARVARLRQ